MAHIPSNGPEEPAHRETAARGEARGNLSVETTAEVKALFARRLGELAKLHDDKRVELPHLAFVRNHELPRFFSAEKARQRFLRAKYSPALGYFGPGSALFDRGINPSSFVEVAMKKPGILSTYRTAGPSKSGEATAGAAHKAFITLEGDLYSDPWDTSTPGVLAVPDKSMPLVAEAFVVVYDADFLHDIASVMSQIRERR